MERQYVSTGSTNIKIGSGHNDEGAWHRAVLIAKSLHDAGLWDGVEEITINDPYEVHGRLEGVDPVSPYELKLGVDYRFETRELSAYVTLDMSKPYLITPEQYRVGEYGKKRRDGTYKVYARWGKGWRAVDHVTRDDETGEYFIWFFGIDAPQPVANTYCIEAQPQKLRYGVGTPVRIGRLIENLRHHEHERVLRHLFLTGATGEVVETSRDTFATDAMSYHIRFQNGTFAWLHEVEAVLASEPYDAVEPRIVNRELVAVSAICRDCGQQYDAVFRRATYLNCGLEHLLINANNVSVCPICERVEYSHKNHYMPEGKMITGVQPVVIINPRDTEEMPGAVVTLEATGKEGERLHPAPCGYPEYLCSCEPDDEDGIEDPALRRFLAEHGNDIAALQKSLIEMSNLANELARENKRVKALNDQLLDRQAELQQRFLDLQEQVEAPLDPAVQVKRLLHRIDTEVAREHSAEEIADYLNCGWQIVHITDSIRKEDTSWWSIVTLQAPAGTPVPSAPEDPIAVIEAYFSKN